MKTTINGKKHSGQAFCKSCLFMVESAHGDFHVTCKWMGYSLKEKFDWSNTLLNPSVIERVLPACWCLATWTHVRTTMALWRMPNTCFGALLDPHAPDYLIFHIRVSMIETHTLNRRGLMHIGCEKPTSKETEASESGPLWASGKSQRCGSGVMESWAPDVSTCLSQAVCSAGSKDW